MTAVALGLILGMAFGAAAQRRRFCLLRGLKGLRPGGDLTALRAFALAMLVSLLATQVLYPAGGTDLGAAMPLRAVNPWPSRLIGGALFGLGMVLANACGARSLVLLAAGNLRSLLVLLCLGLSAQATLTGVLAPVRTAVQEATGAPLPAASLPQLLANAGFGYPMALSVTIPAVLLGWFALPLLRRSPVEAAMAATIGLAVAGGWWITFATDDPFDPRPLVSLSFVGPVGESLLWTMLAAGRALGFGAAVVGGTLAGAFAAAALGGGFRPESFGSPRQTVFAAAGGLLMGFGGVLALGCSIGHGLSGFSTLSLGSLVALAGIVAGALAGLSLVPKHAHAGAIT